MKEKGNHSKVSNRKSKKMNKKQDKNTKIKFSKKHPVITIIIRIILILILLLSVIGAGIVIGMVYGGWGENFEITPEELTISTSNSVILDSEGNKLAELSGDENRKIVKLNEMPENLKKAYVSIEDERYYTHKGVDLKRTGGAIFKYITHRGDSSFGGGSTITQQLVKNLTKEKDRNGIAGILRKVKEWAKAYQIEQMLSKDQILELYLNIIFVGGNNYGVEMGAEYYFNKNVGDLDLAECVFLAGINNSPNSYNPYGEKDKTELIKKRCKTVLKKMLDLGKITKEEYDEAYKKVDEGLTFEKAQSGGTIYSYHTDATISQVISDIAEAKGMSTNWASTYVYSGGLTIYSTQDTELQEKMDEVMVNDSKSYIRKSKQVDDATSQSAMVIIDNETGYVVGCVGGLGEKTESRGLNRATQSPRQTGSSIKPLTSLIPGINEGVITAATIYDDTKAIFNGLPNWEPKDYNTPRGLITVREAIRTSQNLPCIKIVAELTPEKSIEYLEKMGVTTIDHERDGLAALSIGGFTTGISPLEMAGCYATIANNGVYRRPLFYTKITDSNGNTVLEPEQKEEQVISEQAASVITNILQTVVESGTATYCDISGQEVAAKTGTTNDNNDKWLCGFTKHYTASCWYGFDKKEEVTGSNNVAGKIWSAVMKKVHVGKESQAFGLADGVVTARVCKNSGKLATSRCSNTYEEVFVDGFLPEECNAHSSSARICDDTGLLANKYCPNVTVRYYSYSVEKEELGLWRNINPSSSAEPPSVRCTEHNASNTESEETGTEDKGPTITLNGDASMTLNEGDSYVEKGATAKDPIDGDISSKVLASGVVSTSKAGTYTVTYTVKNSKGKTATAKRTITVKATEKEQNKPAKEDTPNNKKEETSTETENETTETSTEPETTNSEETTSDE